MSQETFEALAKRVEDFVEKRGWKRYHRPKDIAIALSIESAELLEIFQWRGGSGSLGKEDLEKVRMETADTVIYALCMANACGFDLGKAVKDKISLNAKKYPVVGSKDMFDR
jgi:NTP pyrophosphatase (non-canonical NTP hydrolase)